MCTPQYGLSLPHSTEYIYTVPHSMGYVMCTLQYFVCTCIPQYGVRVSQCNWYMYLTVQWYVFPTFWGTRIPHYGVHSTGHTYMCPVLWDTCTVRYFGIRGSRRYTYPTVQGTCTTQLGLHVHVYTCTSQYEVRVWGTCIPM